MVKVSNDTLAILMVAVIVVIIGAVVSLTWLKVPITGAGSEGGIVSFEVAQITTIDLLSNVSFGQGSINTTFSKCTLESNDSTVPSCWLNTTPYIPDLNNFTIMNLANADMNVSIKTNETAKGFINGTDPTYNWSFLSCSTGCTNNVTEREWYAFAAASPTDYEIVGKWVSGSSTENMTVGIQIKVPDDTVGARSNTVTFTSVALPT